MRSHKSFIFYTTQLGANAGIYSQRPVGSVVEVGSESISNRFQRVKLRNLRDLATTDVTVHFLQQTGMICEKLTQFTNVAERKV